MNVDSGERPSEDSRKDEILKTCSRCKTPRPLTAFHKNPTNRDGLSYCCAACIAVTAEKWRKSHKDQIRAHGQQYYQNNREHVRARNQKRHYKTSFNLDMAEVEKIRAYQGNRCAICRHPLERRANLDHRHTDGLIRGFLCWRCNRALGLFFDSADSMFNAIVFLFSPPAVAALGRAHFGWPGRVGTKKQRKLAKKNPSPPGVFEPTDWVSWLMSKIKAASTP